MAGLVTTTISAASGTNNNNISTNKNELIELDNKNVCRLSSSSSSAVTNLNVKTDADRNGEDNLVEKISGEKNTCSINYLNNKNPVDGLNNNFFERQRSLQNLFGKTLDKNLVYHRQRSNSDGATLVKDNPEILLTQAKLDIMGLKNETSKDHTAETSLEQKFTSLALSFTIDASSINERCDRQRRKRDQNQRNFNLEVDKLKSKLTYLQPLCNDFESAELLSTLFSQVDILTRAASLVTNSAERFGAVQHEKQLTESVQLMIGHVQALKQQRDSARRQLQYTKRVLQEPLNPTSTTMQNNLNKGSFLGLNKKVISRRRASVDSVNLLNHHQDKNTKLNRRISDLSFKASLAKTNRPSRLDLGMELKKIKEIVAVDEHNKDNFTRKSSDKLIVQNLSRDDSDFDLDLQRIHTQDVALNYILKVPWNFIIYCWTKIPWNQEKVLNFLNRWSGNNYMNALLNSCAIVCFSVSILTLISLFMEQESAMSFWLLLWNQTNNVNA